MNGTPAFPPDHVTIQQVGEYETRTRGGRRVVRKNVWVVTDLHGNETWFPERMEQEAREFMDGVIQAQEKK